VNPFLAAFARMPPAEAAAWFLAINVALFALCLGGGAVLVRVFHARRVAPVPPPLERREVVLAAVCVVLNSAVTFAGWMLFRAGIIVVRPASVVGAVLDTIVLLVAMDLAMYLLHRLAHVRRLYPLLHALHHRYEHPRPLTLFVLNPFEVLGFGSLWLAVLCVYSSTWAGICVYLALNAFFGTIGHLGVEPLPDGAQRLALIRHLGSSRFHAEHHLEGKVNFGFYTDMWDRLFGTRKAS
jgi:lathosterol oxidase